MTQLIVIAFDHFDDARTAMTALRSLEHDGQIGFEDTAVVERDPDGTAHVRNEVSGTTETATAVGALIGGVVGFLFPLAGIALGAALGALVGRSLERGVSDAFSRRQAFLPDASMSATRVPPRDSTTSRAAATTSCWNRPARMATSPRSRAMTSTPMSPSCMANAEINRVRAARADPWSGNVAAKSLMGASPRVGTEACLTRRCNGEYPPTVWRCSAVAMTGRRNGSAPPARWPRSWSSSTAAMARTAGGMPTWQARPPVGNLGRPERGSKVVMDPVRDIGNCRAQVERQRFRIDRAAVAQAASDRSDQLPGGVAEGRQAPSTLDVEGAERRVQAAEPGSAEAAEASALSDHLREEYRRAHDARVS